MATIETLAEKQKRLASERRAQEEAESTRRQAEQLAKTNRENAERSGARQTLENLLAEETSIVLQLRGAGAGNSALETRLAEIQKQIVAQAKVVSGFDRAYVENLGLVAE